MDFDEHQKLREFDLEIMEKRFKTKLSFEQAMQKLKLEYLAAKEKVGDKRHEQRIQIIEREFDVFLKRIEQKEKMI